MTKDEKKKKKSEKKSKKSHSKSEKHSSHKHKKEKHKTKESTIDSIDRPSISIDDYYLKSEEFRVWLKMSNHK